MMTINEMEAIKAYFYGYDKDTISENCDITIEEIETIINKNKDYMILSRDKIIEDIQDETESKNGKKKSIWNFGNNGCLLNYKSIK